MGINRQEYVYCFQKYSCQEYFNTAPQLPVAMQISGSSLQSTQCATKTFDPKVSSIIVDHFYFGPKAVGKKTEQNEALETAIKTPLGTGQSDKAEQR